LRETIALKLWLLIVLLVSITLLAVGLSLNTLLENLYFDIEARSMINQGKKIDALMRGTATPRALSQEMDIISSFIEGHVMAFDRKGMIGACDSEMPMQPGMHLKGEEIEEVLKGNIVVRRGRNFGFKKSMLMVAIPIEENNEVLGAIMLFKPVEPIAATLNNFRRLILLTAIGAIILATIVGFFISRKIARPMLIMNEVAKRVAAGDFTGRVPVETQDEVGNLAKTINFMSEELEKNIGALSTEKERLSNILKSMDNGVITFTGDDQVIQANPQVEKILGINFEEQSIKELPYWNKVRNLIRKARENEVFMEDEIELDNKTIALRAAPLKEQGNGTRGVVLVLQDITLKKKAEKLRRQFLSSVSHELRTPLSLLQGYAEALADGMATSAEERKEYLKIISEEATRLNRIVDDLVDLNAMEAGQLTLNMSEFYLQDVIESIVRIFKPAAEEQNVQLEYHLQEEIPLFYGDQGRIEQVLINLVNNAIKYTPSGGKITLQVGYQDDKFIIKISDTGEGIPTEDLPHIWERFYRVDKARTRKTGGSGLGLAIVKSLVEAHKGSVNVRSRLGEGSTFTVILPRSDSERKKFTNG